MAYTPPSPTAAHGFFSDAYTPPASNAVNGGFTAGGAAQTAFPSGFEGTEFGSLLATWTQVPQMQGWDSSVFSLGRIYPYGQVNADFTVPYTPPAPIPLNIDFAGAGRSLFPSGWVATEFGTTYVHFTGDVLAPSGWDSSAFGTAKTVRFIKPHSFDVSVFGLPHDVDYEIRYRYMTGISSLVFGTTKIGTRQYLQPQGDTQTKFGVAQVGYQRFLTVTGWESMAVGTPAIDWVRLQPSGFEQAQYGTGSIKLGSNYLLAAGLTQTGIGDAGIFLLQRYVLPPSIGSDLGAGPATGYGFPTLTGPGDPLKPSGWTGLRFGTALIANSQYPLIPTSIFDGAVGLSDISHRIRSIVPLGLDATLFGETSVYNAAQGLRPSGTEQSAFGHPDIRDKAQHATVAATLPFTEYGTAFIAYAVRTLQVYFPPEPPLFDGPVIQLKTHYIQPAGFEATLFPQSEIAIHRTVVTPFSIDPPVLTSLPSIRNRNYEIHPGAATHTFYGNWSIHKSKLEVAGFDALSVGNAVIRDRKQTLVPTGWNSLVVPQHSIRPDPYVVVQRLRPVGWTDSDFPPQPHLSSNVLQMFGIASTAFGLTPQIRNVDRVLKPKGWIDSDYNELFGTPSLIFTQFIQPNGIGPPLTQVPDPRLSPNYILAPKSGFPVDGESVKIGIPSLQHKNRVVRQDIPLFGTAIGTARIGLRNRKVFVLGFNSFRYGAAKMGGGISTYPISSAGDTSEIPITHKVAHVIPYSPFVLPPGIDSETHGITRIELKNRELLFETDFDDHTRYGFPGVFRSPRFIQAVGNEMTIWGPATFIADRVRHIYPLGWDSLNSKSSYPVQSTGSRVPKGITPVHALR